MEANDNERERAYPSEHISGYLLFLVTVTRTKEARGKCYVNATREISVTGPQVIGREIDSRLMKLTAFQTLFIYIQNNIY